MFKQMLFYTSHNMQTLVVKNKEFQFCNPKRIQGTQNISKNINTT